MPEYLRALIFVLILSSATWMVIQSSTIHTTSSATARQWRNLWFGISTIAFVANSFWFYSIVVSLIFLIHRPTPIKALAFYALLLTTVPAAQIIVPGFGLVNYLFLLNQPKLLALILLLPAAIVIAGQKKSANIGKNSTDKFFLAYILLAAALQLRESTLTDALRNCFYLFINTFLPYYVASRALRYIEDFRAFMTAFCTSMALFGTIAVFEMFKHWNLYNGMAQMLGIEWGLGGYLSRDGLLRAHVTTGQPIALGYIMSIGLAFQLYLLQAKEAGRRRSIFYWAPAILIASGLLASLSRGPWVGMAATLIAFTLTGKSGPQNTAKLGVIFIITLGILSIFEFGQKFVDMLPYIGNVDKGNITYREDLFSNALIVIKRNLWFGSIDYLKTEEMLRMVQGQQIIDLVNTYLGVTLDHGLFGLLSFSGIFLSVLWKIWSVQRRLPTESEERILGRCIMSAIFGTMITIATVSSISFIPYVYWLVVGSGVAWLEMIRQKQSRLNKAVRRQEIEIINQ